MSALPPRHLVYSSRKARTYLCVVAANSCREALRIARRIFQLKRDAFAVLETPR